MNGFNPEKKSESKSWNSTSVEDRLGFIFRDQSTTNAQPTPMVVPRLGYDFANFMAERDVPRLGSSIANFSGGRWMKTGTAENQSNYGIPGILTYDFVPLFAQSTAPAYEGYQINRGEVPDIFINTWTLLKLLNNMTEKFMPSDIQWVFCGYMEILTHVENLRRILRIMQRVTRSAKSEYVREEALISALGFPMDQATMRQNWLGWRNFFNVSILGALRNIPWFTKLIPGYKRWAGLCKEIYKDDPNRTDYTQLYAFRPRYINHVFEGIIDNTPDQAQLFGWKMEQEPYMFFDDVAATPKAAFESYLNFIAQYIRDVFYSDSASLIIATINAIDVRNWTSDPKLTIEKIDLEDIPMDLTSEELPFTYDFNVLLSIHNATIFKGDENHFQIMPAEQNWTYDSQLDMWSTDGTIKQDVYIWKDLGDHATPSVAEYNVWISSLAKAVNLPWYNATMDDFINATQWTVLSNPDTLSEFEYKMHPDAAATELLVREVMYYTKYNRSTGFSLEYVDTSNWHWLTPQNNANYVYTILSRFNTFDLYPLVYITDKREEGGRNHYEAVGIANQEDVLYCASEQVLHPLHAQFIRNFWGYPFNVGGTEGSRNANGAPHGDERA